MEKSVVWQEWDAIAFPSGRWEKDQNFDAWLNLFHRCYNQDQWQVPLDEAFLISTQGMGICVLTDRFPLAIELAHQLRNHPDFAHLRPHDLQIVDRWEACAQLSLGNAPGAVRILRKILERPQSRQTVLGTLAGYCEINPHQPVAEEVRDFVQDLLTPWPGKKRLAQRATKATTLGDLFEILTSHPVPS